MKIQELIIELTEALEKQENNPESEARLRQELSGISHEVEKMVVEIAQRAQDLVDHEEYRNFIARRLDKLKGDTSFWGEKFDPDKVMLPLPLGEPAPRSPKNVNRGAEQSKKILRSKEIKELTEDLDNYNSKLEFEISRYRERQSELQQKQVQQELLERRIESLEESPDVRRLRKDLGEAFEDAKDKASKRLPHRLNSDFQGWCRRNGFLAEETLSLDAIALNWKRARISSGRFESESESDSAKQHRRLDDSWILEAAFKSFLLFLTDEEESGRG